ncbi:hypothetical protein Tco_0379871, partial [Tanacetum coccineum]|jgi:hypothetical protein
MKGVL